MFYYELVALIVEPVKVTEKTLCQSMSVSETRVG